MRSKIVIEKKKIEDELNSINEDIMSMRTGSGWALSSAASTGYGLRSGTLAQPPSFAAGWQIEWVPRGIGIKKWMTDWEHSKENEGPWPRKTMVNLWFPHGTEMGLIIETLGES